MESKRIKIYRTETEFEALDKRVKELGKPDLNSYLRSEIYKLEKEIKRCPNCITEAKGGEKKERVHYIPDDTYATLLIISRRMNKHVATIIDDFIIAPLLQGKVSEQQQQIPQKQH